MTEKKNTHGGARGQGRHKEGKVYAHFRLKPETIELVSRFKARFKKGANDELDKLILEAIKNYLENPITI